MKSCVAKGSTLLVYLRLRAARPLILLAFSSVMTTQCEGNYRFFTETPVLHSSGEVQSYIEQEIMKPSKAWVQEVVSSKRENEWVKLRTQEFVLLPDTNAHRRQYRPPLRDQCSARCPRPFARWQQQGLERGTSAPCWQQPPVQAKPAAEWQAKSLNWLAIVADPAIRSIRDLRGEHVPMLETLYEECVKAIQKEFKVEKHDIMVFANYPPSVYKLHFHFCAPFFTSSAYDAFRMHPLSNIINNLKLCSDYYKLSSLVVPVHVGSELFRVARDQAEKETTE